jgi:hypothetical protein
VIGQSGAGGPCDHGTVLCSNLCRSGEEAVGSLRGGDSAELSQQPELVPTVPAFRDLATGDSKVPLRDFRGEYAWTNLDILRPVRPNADKLRKIAGSKLVADLPSSEL